MSLRTKGLLLIVIISLIPLIIAGYSNYSAVKSAILQTENDKLSSRLDNRAKEISSLMAIRQAELLVMSRTRLVRFGTDEQRIEYFHKEAVRSGYANSFIGYSGLDGLAIRNTGEMADITQEPFFKVAVNGISIITDPYTPSFSETAVCIIAVPVYNNRNEIQGVLFSTIPFASLTTYLQFPNAATPTILYNRKGEVLFHSDGISADFSPLNDPDSSLYEVSSPMLESEDGHVLHKEAGATSHIFFVKIKETPWRVALQVPEVAYEKKLHPVFWRILIMIVLTEATIVILFFFYFERIIKRLKKILSVTELAADGHFRTERLAVEPNDEIGMLAHSVNGMTEHLEDMFDRLSAIINQNQYAVIVLDEHYRVSYMNQAAEQMLGYQLDELKGKATPNDFIDQEIIDKEAAELSEMLGRKVEPNTDYFKALQALHHSYEREWIFVRKNGTKVPVLLSSNGLQDGQGRFAGVVGMIQDITERRHTENMKNRLLEILESAKDLIASSDAHGNIVYMNRAGKDMLAMNKRESELISRIEDFTEPQMYESLKKGARQASEQGYWENDVVLHGLDGQAVYVSMAVVPHRDWLNGELFFSCIARDVTEQRKVHEELILATMEADEANRAKSHFLALMSHEIRTPLNGIVGLLQLLNKTKLSTVQQEYMDKLTTSSETLLRIINDVLDFSKIEAGKVEIEKFPFELDDLLERVSRQLSVFLSEKKKLQFIVEKPEGLTIPITGDPIRLEQVLLNLCTNAIKFTHAGYVKLSAILYSCKEQQAEIHFQVTDTGIGMSEEQLSKLFTPFTQADSSTTRRFGGTGLGLVISKTFVELMGGELKVDSIEGAGSTFTFQLSFGLHMQQLPPADAQWTPLEHTDTKKTSLQEKIIQINKLAAPFLEQKPVKLIRARKAQGQLPEGATVELADEETAAAGTIRYMKPRVLLAEDNKINQMVALEMLEQGGYETGLAENGSEALQKFAAGHWDLVLMDIHMPLLDGVETARTIRRQVKYHHIPIVAMTANAVKKDHEMYIASGMNDVIMKPIRAETLYHIIDYWIHGEGKQRLMEEKVDITEEKQEKKNSIAGMSLEHALERINGKINILHHMIRQFTIDYSGFMDHFNESVQERQHHTAYRMLHTLRGASGYLAASEVHKKVSQLLVLLKNENEIDWVELEQESKILQQDMQVLIRGMENYLKEQKTSS